MPQIVVTASTPGRRAGREVMRERVVVSDLESELFIAHLIERIEWALSDADSIEIRETRETDSPAQRPRRRRVQALGA